MPENERICAACGSKLVEIGKEVRRSLMMKPTEFWVREDIYYTYACKNCEQETGESLRVLDFCQKMARLSQTVWPFFHCRTRRRSFYL